MLCIFHLGRRDVLPVGDLGVRKGMQTIYGLKQLPDPGTMRKLAQPWAPYRTLGVRWNG
jgi:DNA-3-methyladenine glycosylase II